MNNIEKLLPLGSIVLLKESLQKIMVIGRGAIYMNQETQEDVFSDYMAVLYPAGMNPETTIFFNHEDIDKVLFTGYSDDEEERFLEIYAEWKKNLDEENQTSTPDETMSFGFE